MNEFDLPPELVEVERRLTERGRAQPSAAFRRRVLTLLHRRRHFTWRIAAQLAAAVLLSLNLAMSLANPMPRTDRERSENGDYERIVAVLREKSPELTEPEAYRLVALARSTAVLAAVPALPRSLDRILEREESGSWDRP